uniref:complement C1q tumor necrosis factor-related protein 3-like n=1 Tax=Pristiophorus japonicus TaxID=55135 RepID=UPI00398F855D
MASRRLRNLVFLIILQSISLIHASRNLRKDFQADVHEMSGQRNELEFIEESQAKVERLPSGPVKADVVFNVMCSNSNHVIEPVNPIIYDEVRVNQGQGYSTETGKFTCPMSGLYFFSYSSLPGRGVHTNVMLMKNDQEVSCIHSALPVDSSQLSERNVILNLQKKDQVWVQLHNGDLRSNAGSLSFQGFRLAE